MRGGLGGEVGFRDLRKRLYPGYYPASRIPPDCPLVLLGPWVQVVQGNGNGIAAVSRVTRVAGK